MGVDGGDLLLRGLGMDRVALVLGGEGLPRGLDAGCALHKLLLARRGHLGLRSCLHLELLHSLLYEVQA